MGRQRRVSATGSRAEGNPWVEPYGSATRAFEPWEAATYEPASLASTLAYREKRERAKLGRAGTARGHAAVVNANCPERMDRLRDDAATGVPGAKVAVADAERELARRALAEAAWPVLRACKANDFGPYRALPKGDPIRRAVDRALGDDDRARKGKEQAQRDKRRIEHGYERNFQAEFGGEVLKPFRHEGFPSVEHPHGRRFVQAIPRRGLVQCGDTKESVARARSKAEALDAPYVVANKVVRSFLLVDLDRRFPGGHDEAIAAIRACRPPILPHLLVGKLLVNGELVNPHAIFFLDHDARVWWEGDGRVPVLFSDVHAALVDCLAPAGSDPGVLVNGGTKPKNPLCPLWSRSVPNERKFLTLGEMAALLPMRRAGSDLRAAAGANDMPEGVSNAVFKECRVAALAALRGWAAARDPAYLAALADRDALAEMLRAAMRPVAARYPGSLLEADAEDDGSTKRSRRGPGYVLDSVARYVAARHDPTRIRKVPRDRGALAGTLAGMTVAERQAAGARYASAVAAEGSLTALAAARAAMLGTGREDDRGAVAERAGVSRATAYRLWAGVLERCGGAEGESVGESTGRRDAALTVRGAIIPTPDETPKKSFRREAAVVAAGTAESDVPRVDADWRCAAGSLEDLLAMVENVFGKCRVAGVRTGVDPSARPSRADGDTAALGASLGPTVSPPPSMASPPWWSLDSARGLEGVDEDGYILDPDALLEREYEACG